MTEEKTKVIRVSTETLNTLKQLSNRTQIDMLTLLDDIFKQIQLQLDLMESGKKLLFMADLYNKDNMPKVIIRLSDNIYSSLAEIPNELRAEIYKAFGYEWVNGHLKDLTEVDKKE